MCLWVSEWERYFSKLLASLLAHTLRQPKFACREKIKILHSWIGYTARRTYSHQKTWININSSAQTLRPDNYMYANISGTKAGFQKTRVSLRNWIRRNGENGNIWCASTLITAETGHTGKACHSQAKWESWWCVGWKNSSSFKFRSYSPDWVALYCDAILVFSLSLKRQYNFEPTFFFLQKNTTFWAPIKVLNTSRKNFSFVFSIEQVKVIFCDIDFKSTNTKCQLFLLHVSYWLISGASR